MPKKRRIIDLFSPGFALPQACFSWAASIACDDFIFVAIGFNDC